MKYHAMFNNPLLELIGSENLGYLLISSGGQQENTTIDEFWVANVINTLLNHLVITQER